MDEKKQDELEEVVKDEIEENNVEEEIIEDTAEDAVGDTDNIDEEKEPTKEFDIDKVNETEVKEESIVDDKKEELLESEKVNKKLYIILGIVALVLVVLVIVLVIILNKDDDKKDKEEAKEPSVQENPNSDVPNDEECQNVIKEYGNKLVIYVRDHIASGHDVASIKQDAMTTLIENYTVKCETFELENNGNVKLSNCSINNSEAIYNYEKTYSATTDNDYEVASKNGKLTFYADGWYLYDAGDSDYEDVKKYTISCEEDSCVLDKIYAYYAIVKEESGKSIVYNLTKNEKIYTALAGYDVNIVGRYDKDYNDSPVALTLRNPEKQEALYSLKDKKIVLDYGQYTYNWKSDSNCFDSCDNVVVYDFMKIYSGKKIGLVNMDTFSIALEPTDYDEMSVNRDYIYVKKDDYEGLLEYDKNKDEIVTIVKPNKYTEVTREDNYILIVKSGKFGALDVTGQKQLLNGKFYDAIAVANYNGGGALVLDGNILKVLDIDGNLIKNLGQLPAGAKLYADLGFGAYDSDDEEEGGINAWIKFTNPNYDENANDAYYDCEERCTNDEALDGDEYIACQESCEQYYNEEASHDCFEYNYNFTKGELEKIPTECEGGYAKPVLYLYPTLPTLVEVTFDKLDNLTTTYPKYKNSWNVLAHPNGDLYDLSGKYYYALYWEENSNHKVDFKEGFYVTKNNAIEFLEEKLTRIGLNDKERNEFIMYWLPILEENGKSLVYFELTEERDTYSKINISPKPNSLLRLAIHIKKVDSYTKIKEQHLPTFKRNGFTAVEWGGVLY